MEPSRQYDPLEISGTSLSFPGVRIFNSVLRLLIAGIMATLCIWIATGLGLLLISLYEGISTGSWLEATEDMITKVVMLLAMLELVRTLQSYLELGRVKVTFILDAALVVLIGELIALWYRDYTIQEIGMSLTAIVVLTALRISTVKFSPNNTT